MLHTKGLQLVERGTLKTTHGLATDLLLHQDGVFLRVDEIFTGTNSSAGKVSRLLRRLM
jgi:hypothetical protein